MLRLGIILQGFLSRASDKAFEVLNYLVPLMNVCSRTDAEDPIIKGL